MPITASQAPYLYTCKGMQINALRIKVPVTRTEVKKDPKPSRRTQMLIFKHVIGTIYSYTDQVIRGSLQRNKML
jgi:hypothetical protein